MPNDGLMPNNGGNGGSLSGGAPATNPTPTAMPSSIAPNPISPAVNANSNPLTNNTLTNSNQNLGNANPLTTPNPVDIAPVEKPFDIGNYGGQQKLDAAMSFYDKLAANNFDSVDFLSHIAEVAPDRFNAINKTVLENYMPALQESFIQNLAQDPEMKASALQVLGWDANNYQAFQNYVKSGQTERLQNPDPRYQALQSKVDQMEAEKLAQQQQAIYDKRQTDYESFRSEFTQPVNDFIQKMNLPDTKEGNLAKAMLRGATDRLFEENEKAFKMANNSFQAFMDGNGQLARNNTAYALRAAVQEKAQEVAVYLGDLMHKASIYDQMQSQPGMRRDPLIPVQSAPTGQRQPAANPQGNNQQSNDIPFDPESVLARVKARLGIN